MCTISEFGHHVVDISETKPLLFTAPGRTRRTEIKENNLISRDFTGVKRLRKHLVIISAIFFIFSFYFSLFFPIFCGDSLRDLIITQNDRCR